MRIVIGRFMVSCYVCGAFMYKFTSLCKFGAVAACRVLCVSRTVCRMNLVMGVLVVPYSASLTLYGTTSTPTAGLN